MLEVDLTKKFIAEQLINYRNGNTPPEPILLFDPAENCELCPEDKKALEYFETKQRERNDLFAEIKLFELRIPDPNRKFTPEER